MNKFIKFFCLFFLIFTFGFSVSAKEISHFYAEADESIGLADNVDGSAFLAGGSVESSGHINGANFMAGNNLEFSGESDYAVIAGNYIRVNGVVQKDTVIAGNIINIGKKSLLNRDVIIFGSDIEIKGSIKRNVTLYGQKVSIKGASVHGNIRIFAEDITIDDYSIISGKLSYPKDAKVSISSNITNIEKISPIQTDKNDLINYLMSNVWSFMSIVFIFAILTLFYPKLFEYIQNSFKEIGFNRCVETFSKGLVFMIIVPAICLVLFMLPFGISLSLILLALYMIIVYLSQLFTGYLIGFKLWHKFLVSDINLLLVGMLGYSILFVLELIPIFGGIVKIFVCLFGVGIISDLFFKKKS